MEFVIRSTNNLYFSLSYLQVVYNDGDTQRLSLKEVRLSLVDEIQVPPQVVLDCQMHYAKGTYLIRTPLPTIS